MTPESIHRDMVDSMPELGLFCFDMVLSFLGGFTWEQYPAGNEDVVRRSFDYIEWLLGVCDPELARLAVDDVFRVAAFRAEVADWIGPRTHAELRLTDWAAEQPFFVP